jgi:hypothetical protein
LFETLSQFKDINGNHPQITANSLVANPDFDEIKKSNNTEYFFETIDKTFASYPNHVKSMDLWYEGEDKGVFFLQYHGREHFNNAMFMNALKEEREEALWVLENKMGGSISKEIYKNRYVSASQFNSETELKEGIKNIKEGLLLFKKLHNKESKSYIATNYTWPVEFERVLAKEGVQYIQGSFRQKLPKINTSKQKGINHFLGEKNIYNQVYLVRNVAFEPSITHEVDIIGKTLKQINTAFNLKKPAIISSHRVNYIGNIFEENRDKNLIQLAELLKKIQKNWADVEFFNSVELGDLINITD